MTLVSQLSFRDMYHRGCFFAMNDYALVNVFWTQNLKN